jgi:hypothetical protein
MNMAGPVRVIALAGALCFAATACGGGGKVNTSAATTTKPADPTTTVDPAATQRAAVLDAYQQYWDAYKHALAAANPDDLEIAAHATGDQLGLLKVQLAGLRDAPKPEVVHVTAELHPKIAVLEPSKAVIQDCFVETDAYFTRDGEPSGTPQSFKAGGEFELLLEGGSWKVSKKTHQDNACAS